LRYEWDLFRPKEKWYYGQSNEDLDKCDLFIKTVKGVKSLKPEDRDRCTVIYINVDKDIRLERLNERNDADDAKRRLEADDKDFEGFNDFDVEIKNHDF